MRIIIVLLSELGCLAAQMVRISCLCLSGRFVDWNGWMHGATDG